MSSDYRDDGTAAPEVDAVAAHAPTQHQRNGRRVRFHPGSKVVEVTGYGDLDQTANAFDLLSWLIHEGQRSEPERLRDVLEVLDAVCGIAFGKELHAAFFPWPGPRVMYRRRGTTQPTRRQADA
jgi:hypothetical protein